MIRLPAALWLVSIVLAGGCKKNAPESSGDERASPDREPAEAATTDEVVRSSVAIARLGDREIVDVLATANAAEIDSGSLALKKSRDAEVKTFATEMITGHGAASAKTETVAATLDLKPEANDTSKGMKQTHDYAVEGLWGLDGFAFDKAYVDLAVKAHTELLDTIDRVLLPSAQNDELVALITELRPTVAAHLDHAKRLQTTQAAATDDTL